jgi:hypothetical protein
MSYEVGDISLGHILAKVCLKTFMCQELVVVPLEQREVGRVEQDFYLGIHPRSK